MPFFGEVVGCHGADDCDMTLWGLGISPELKGTKCIMAFTNGWPLRPDIARNKGPLSDLDAVGL